MGHLTFAAEQALLLVRMRQMSPLLRSTLYRDVPVACRLRVMYREGWSWAAAG